MDIFAWMEKNNENIFLIFTFKMLLAKKDLHLIAAPLRILCLPVAENKSWLIDDDEDEYDDEDDDGIYYNEFWDMVYVTHANNQFLQFLSERPRTDTLTVVHQLCSKSHVRSNILMLVPLSHSSSRVCFYADPTTLTQL